MVQESQVVRRAKVALRRVVSISALEIVLVVLLATAWLWIPVVLLLDLLRKRLRFPLVRLMTFAVCWLSIELLGVLASIALWVSGNARNQNANYALQRWWANALMVSLRFTCGVRVEVSGTEYVPPGQIMVLSRHTSLADSLVSAWVLGNKCGRTPRYVLKKELAFDPCLDIVGHRLPNHFVNREASDVAGEIASLLTLANHMGDRDAIVIFPEGTRSNPAKRARRLAELSERNPQRAERLARLRFLLPPKPSGAVALLESLPNAGVVVCAHTGFDGMDSFTGMLRSVSRGPVAVRFDLRSIARPVDDPVGWLDSVWLELDARVAILGGI